LIAAAGEHYLNTILDQLVDFAGLMKNNVPVTLMLLALFWGVFFISFLTGYRLNILGIYPRRFWGLPGIICSPFLHGDFNHLFFNSIPLFVLINFILIEGLTRLIDISLTIIILSGCAVWLLGRRAIHIGASGLIMGYFSYLLVNAYQHPSISSVILAVVCLYYFGGFLLDLFPREERVSWEGHLFGFLAGLAAVFIWSPHG